MSEVEFLPSGVAEYGVLVVAFVLGGVALWLVGRVCSPMVIQDEHATDDYRVKLTEWERERVLSAAKGIAAASSGFFLTLVVALLKDEVAADVSALALIGCLLGAIGMLMMATHLSLSAARFALARSQPTKREVLTW